MTRFVGRVLAQLVSVPIFCLVSVLLSTNAVAKPSQLEVVIQSFEGASSYRYFVLPVPNFTISREHGFELSQAGRVLDFSANAHLMWPQANTSRYYRGVLFKVTGLNAGELTIRWAKNLTKPSGIIAIEEPLLVEAEFTDEWLNMALYSPVIYNANNIDWGWFDNAYWRYASYSADEVLIGELSKPKDPAKKTTLPSNSAAPWLYDRPYTFYQLYFKTADRRWKTTAHQQAQFFISQLDKNGDFALKGSADLKYMLSAGLLIDYLFYPHQSTKLVIEEIAAKGLSWPARYSSNLGFWTERHLSVALGLALNHWELDGSEQAYKRLELLLAGIRDNLWVSMPGRGGCLKHSLKSHSAKNSKEQVCSPWMSALVAEQLWRYFWMTKDQQAAELIVDFAEMLLHQGVYKVDSKGKTLYIPDYLVFFKESIFQDRNS
ncbi:hypothetical protein ACVFI8_07235 [Agarivorans sp. MS3-6]